MADRPLPPFRVALASQDGTQVDRHFGRARLFGAYRWYAGASTPLYRRYLFAER